MQQIMFKVAFEFKTSQYTHTNSTFETVVLALSYDDAANIVNATYSKYKDFSLGPIKPVGIPELAEPAPRVEEGSIVNKMDSLLRLKGM